MPVAKEISERLAQEIVNHGYEPVSEIEVRAMEFAIRQQEITIMTKKKERLEKLYDVLEKLTWNFLFESNALIVAELIAALNLQQNVVDALDEINGELYLERYQN